jgi:N-acetylglucosaminyldiphosphoundecaprenol N-acetyl-beta-D-mannosaminyltransferase
MFINVLKKIDLEFYKGKDISFINPVSLRYLRYFSNNKIYFHSDGFLLNIVFFAFFFKKVIRVSFDFTSLANNIFCDLNLKKETLYIVGATDRELDIFIDKLKKKYSDMKIIGKNNGYFKNEIVVIEKIINLNPDVVLIGLGAKKQEKFQLDLRKSGFVGTTFSCGGFIRQEANSKKDYYPFLINKLNLRFVYRMIKEPHTIKRYFVEYPLNIIIFLSLYLRNKINVNFIK